jgi:hypothetical protein
MNTGRAAAIAAILTAHLSVYAQTAPAWQEWSQSDAQRIAKSTVGTGRIAGGRRLLNTERARSYKLRATWLTPDVVQGTARLLQIRSRLAPSLVEPLIADVLTPSETVVMIEIDPDEGSGVIPLDWEAFLQPRDETERSVAGRSRPALGDSKLLAESFPRNYDYDRFWMVFPLSREGDPLFLESDSEAELVVRIYGREGGCTGRSVRRSAPR